MVLESVSGGLNQSVWLKPRLPQHAVRGLFSFRQGGVSTPPYDSLNVGLHVGDDEAAVLTNRERAAQQLGADVRQFVFAEQVHGNQVAVVDETAAGLGALNVAKAVRGVDALVTNVPGLALAVQSADCVPILLYDAKNFVIAAVHSGWKGTLSHIVRETLGTMAVTYGTVPIDVYAMFGPSIRRCCYEVNEAVAKPFREVFGNRYVMQRHGDATHSMLSLQACIRADLTQVGVPETQIDDCGICTSCRTDLLFSHRKEQGKTGRLIGTIMLVEGAAR